MKNKRFIQPLFIVSPVLVFCLLLSGFGHATIDPNIHWKTMDIPHFTLIFDAKQEALAHDYARWAEQAFDLDTQIFSEHPSRTIIILSDTTDAANGSATYFPYPVITIYPIFPSDLDDITDYKTWGREILLHEYTHILTFQPANGIYTPLRFLFGNIVAPNMLLPRWLTEGLAVEMETRMSDNGRLRSPYFHAIGEAMALDGAMDHETIARANETDIPSWPGGDRPYLFGSFIMDKVSHAKKDPRVLNTLIQDYSRRLPFLINDPVEDETSSDYSELFNQVRTEFKSDAQAKKKIVEKGGVQKPEKLAGQDLNSHDPEVSPDGQHLVYIDRSEAGDSELVVLSRGDKKQTFVSTAQRKTIRNRDNFYESIQRASWFPDSNQIVFDTLHTYRRYDDYSDLYIYNLKKHRVREITFGLRAQAPTVDKTGKWIAFQQNLPNGTTAISEIDPKGKHYKILYQAPMGERASRPEFITGGNDLGDLVFCLRRHGQEELELLHLKSGEFEPILRALAPVSFPRWTSKGLLFTSTVSGVSNIYLANRDLTKARSLTNTVTRAATSDFDPRTGDLYFSELTGKGGKIEVLTAQQLQTPVHNPKVTLPSRFQWPKQKVPQVASLADVKAHSYSSWPYLYPHYWMPMLYLTNGGVLIAADTSANDPLGKQAYSLEAAYDSLLQLPDLAFDYQNSATSVPFDFSASDQYEYFGSSGSAIHQTGGTASADLAPTFHLSTNWGVPVGWTFERESIPIISASQTSNLVLLETGPTVGVRYSNLSQGGKQISPEAGHTYSLFYTDYLPLKHYIHYGRVKASGQIFTSSFLPQHNVLMLNLTGVSSIGLPAIALGSTNSSFPYQTSLLAYDYLVRGYADGSFLGRDVVSANLEYRFPLSYIYQGWGTLPFFIDRLYGYITTDAVSLQGDYYNTSANMFEPTGWGHIFASSGFELHADFKVGFQLPLTLIAGIYHPYDKQAKFGDYDFQLGLQTSLPGLL